jgi:hypothetical protein
MNRLATFQNGQVQISSTLDGAKNIRFRSTNIDAIEHVEVQLARNNIQFRVGYIIDLKNKTLSILHIQGMIVISGFSNETQMIAMRNLIAAYF